MSLFPFYEQFGRELSDTAVNNPAYAQYCQRRGLGKRPSFSAICNFYATVTSRQRARNCQKRCTSMGVR